MGKNYRILTKNRACPCSIKILTDEDEGIVSDFIRKLSSTPFGG